jgi:hypothetical protein
MRYYLSLLTAGLLAVAASADGQGQHPWIGMGTGQLVGTETSEGSAPIHLFMAGACSEGRDRRFLHCYFNSVTISKSENGCRLLASAWVEDLKLVTRTATEAVWAATRGPAGVTGTKTTSTLKVRIGDLSRRLALPGPSDQWEYVSRQTFTKPEIFEQFDGKSLKPTTWQGWTPGIRGRADQDVVHKPAECLPDTFIIDAREEP